MGQALTTLVPGQVGVHWHQGDNGPDVLQATSSLCEGVVLWKT